MEHRLFAFLAKLTSDENIKRIVADRNAGIGYGGFLWKEIHEFRPTHKRRKCGSSVRNCFLEVVFDTITSTNHKIACKQTKIVLENLTQNVDMQANLFTTFNNRMKSKFGISSNEYKYSQTVMKQGTLQKMERKELAEERRRKKHSTILEVSSETIYKAIYDGLTSSDLSTQLIAAALASGSRLIEILALSTFKAKGNFGILAVGVAKNADQKTIFKPVIALTPDEFCLLVERIRIGAKDIVGSYDNLTVDKKQEITQKVDHLANDQVKKIFGPLCHFHDLRAIYGTFSYELFSRDGSLNIWLTKVLGHSDKNMNASLSYCTVKISRDEQYDIMNIKDEVEMLKARYVTLCSSIQVPIANEVALENSSGSKVIFRKQPKRRDHLQQKRISDHVDEMDLKDVPVTWENLLKLGYGTKAIRSFFDK